MTINLDFERIQKAINQIDTDARKVAGENRQVTDSDPIATRLALQFHTDPQYRAALGKFALGMMLLPEECCAALITAGYLMCQEDAKREKKMATLKPLSVTVDDFDRWEPLYTYITESVIDLQNGERVKDFEHYVFERALEAVYGPDVWKEYNELIDGE